MYVGFIINWRLVVKSLVIYVIFKSVCNMSMFNWLFIKFFCCCSVLIIICLVNSCLKMSLFVIAIYFVISSEKDFSHCIIFECKKMFKENFPVPFDGLWMRPKKNMSQQHFNRTKC